MLASTAPSDRLLAEIAECALGDAGHCLDARDAAFGSLRGSLAALFQALQKPDCAVIVGPQSAGGITPGGARVPGTSYELDPATAAFNIGALMCRDECIDSSDTQHRSESVVLGALLSAADGVARRDAAFGRKSLQVQHLLSAIIRAHEIRSLIDSEISRDEQDVLQFERVAAAAMCAVILGAPRYEVIDTVVKVWRSEEGECLWQDRRLALRWRVGSAAGRAAGAAVATSVSAHSLDEDGSAASHREDLSLDCLALAALERRADGDGDAAINAMLEAATARLFSLKQVEVVRRLLADRGALETRALSEFMAMLVKN